MSAASEVWELSRAILGDQDGLIAVIRVYIDESGIHEGTPVTTVAAYMARPKDWVAFTKEWKRAIRPIKVYHAADAASCRGEFEGWTHGQVAELAGRALPIIPKHTKMEDYESALEGKPVAQTTWRALWGVLAMGFVNYSPDQGRI